MTRPRAPVCRDLRLSPPGRGSYHRRRRGPVFSGKASGGFDFAAAPLSSNLGIRR